MEDLHKSLSLIRFCTYYCNSIRTKIDIIRDLLNNCDALLLQEIILLNENKDIFYSIDSNFGFHAFPSRLSIYNNFDNRPAGGLAIMWRKSLGLKVNVINCSIH